MPLTHSELAHEVEYVQEALSALDPQQKSVKERLKPFARRSFWTVILPLTAGGIAWVGSVQNNLTLVLVGGVILIAIEVVYLGHMLWELLKQQPSSEFAGLTREALSRQTKVAETLLRSNMSTLSYVHAFYADQVATLESGMVTLLGPLRTLGLVAWFGAFIAVYSALVKEFPNLQSYAPVALSVAVGFGIAGMRTEDGLATLRKRRDLLARVVKLKEASKDKEVPNAAPVRLPDGAVDGAASPRS